MDWIDSLLERNLTMIRDAYDNQGCYVTLVVCPSAIAELTGFIADKPRLQIDRFSWQIIVALDDSLQRAHQLDYAKKELFAWVKKELCMTIISPAGYRIEQYSNLTFIQEPSGGTWYCVEKDMTTPWRSEEYGFHDIPPEKLVELQAQLVAAKMLGTL